MLPACVSDTKAGLVNGLIGTVDCYIGDFAQGTYASLVGPGTLFATIFTALLTIYIALMGYQLLLGRGALRLTDLPLLALKLGLILSFLTSWAAYQTVVYDFLFFGPQQLAQLLLAQADRLGGTTGTDVFSRLESAFYHLTNAAAVYGRQAGGNVNILQGGPALGSGLLWMSAVAMLLSTVGIILATKVVLGFLLAVGPLFIALFLFEGTRGFFDGWLRTTIAFALTPLSTIVFAAAMLLMIAPFIARVDELAAANRFDMGAIVTITIVVAVFVIVMFQTLRIGFGIASGFSSARRPGYGAGAASLPVAAPAAAPERDRAREMSRAASLLPYLPMPAETSQRAGVEERRVFEMSHAVAETAPSGARLGQVYRRAPLPAGRWRQRDRELA
jgi:type IV secretion system protein VirB6